MISHRIFVYRKLFIIVYVDRLRNRSENEIYARTDIGVGVDLRERRTVFIEQRSAGIFHVLGEMNRFQRRATRKYACTKLGHAFGNGDLGQRRAVTEGGITDFLYVVTDRDFGKFSAEIECIGTDHAKRRRQIDLFHTGKAEECHAFD